MKKQIMITIAMTLICLSKIASTDPTPVQMTAYNISNACTCNWAIPPVCKPSTQNSIDAEFVNIDQSSGTITRQTELEPGQNKTVLSTIEQGSTEPTFAVRKFGSTGDEYSTAYQIIEKSGSKNIYVIGINLPGTGLVPVPMGSNWIDYAGGTCKYQGPNPALGIFKKTKENS